MECIGERALINNRLVDCRDVEKRHTRADLTVYEIFRVMQGVPVFLEDHLQRLFHSLDLEGLYIKEDIADIRERVVRLIDSNTISSGKIRLSVIFNPSGGENRYELVLHYVPFDPPDEKQYKQGVHVVLCSAMRKDPNAKVMHSQARRLADERIRQTGAYEALLVDHEGTITEGSRSNVFFVQGQRLVTPPDDMVLQGIARKNILRICHEQAIAVEVRKVHCNEISGFEAVFLSGTTPKVLPVRTIEKSSFSADNDLLEFLRDAYDKWIQVYVHHKP